MYFFYFYPLGLDRPVRRRPLVTHFLMTLMVVAFLWMQFQPRALPIHPWSLIFAPGNAAPWTALTAVFLHMGWLHLLGNLLYLHVFGPPLEDRLGPGRYLLYFMFMGIGGNLVHGLVSIFGWLGQGGVGVLGASGAIAGMLAFSLVRFYDARVAVGWWVFAPLAGQNRAGRSYVPVAVAVGMWLVLQLVQALLASESRSMVSFGAHFGGFGMGLFLALALGQLKEARAESHEAKAVRYFREGHVHAAIGEWLEYLEMRPDDENAWLELARARATGGEVAAAGNGYRRLFNARLGRGDVAGALDLFAEVDRGVGSRVLLPSEIAKAAYYREKTGDEAGAVDAYEQLFWAFPDHPEGHRALVRVIVLYKGKLCDPQRARRFLDEAARRLPRGGWRHFLDTEFKLESTHGAAPPALREPAVPQTGS